MNQGRVVENFRLPKLAKAANATRAMAGLLLAVVATSASGAETQTILPGLLKKLNLSGYPSTTRPPDFQGSTADGQAVSIGRLAGKVVLINFWATWCQECRIEMPAFERLHRDFGEQGLVVLGVNVRESLPTVRNYATEINLTFPLILDPKGEVYTSYGVIGLPTTFLIARDGRAVALGVGLRDWQSQAARALIQALLAEPIL